MGRKSKKKRGLVYNKRSQVNNKPNGTPVTANQWQATPMQQKWLKLYMDPKEKETWGNAYQAAIAAGYSENYASQIASNNTSLQWVRQAKNIMRLNPEHLKLALATIVSDNYAKDADRIQAIKLLGVDQGMFVQKNITAHVGLEQAIEELE